VEQRARAEEQAEVLVRRGGAAGRKQLIKLKATSLIKVREQKVRAAVVRNDKKEQKAWERKYQLPSFLFTVFIVAIFD
jgi:hypothetical protein